MNSNLKHLLLWLLVAYGLCLIPGQFFNWLVSLLPVGGSGSSCSGSSDWMEWSAHALLMAAVAYSLYTIVRSSRGWILSLVFTMTLIAVIAISIEGLQGLLPPEFHRGPAASDIWASLAGGLFGGLIATVLGFKRSAAADKAVDK